MSAILVTFLTLFISTYLIRSSQAAVQINELHYDNIYTDSREFIEFRHNEPLTGYKAVLYKHNGLPYNTTNLTDTVPSVRPTWAKETNFNYTVVYYQRIINPAAAIALVTPNGTVLEFISYEGNFTARSGPAKGLTSIDIGVEMSNNCTRRGLSLQRCSDVGAWFGPRRSTVGFFNRHCGSAFESDLCSGGAIKPPTKAPTKAPQTSPPTKGPTKSPTKAPRTRRPIPSPTLAPAAPVPIPVPVPITRPSSPDIGITETTDAPSIATNKCGLLRAGIFCPFKCGMIKKWVGLCE